MKTPPVAVLSRVHFWSLQIKMSCRNKIPIKWRNICTGWYLRSVGRLLHSKLFSPGIPLGSTPLLPRAVPCFLEGTVLESVEVHASITLSSSSLWSCRRDGKTRVGSQGHGNPWSWVSGLEIYAVWEDSTTLEPAVLPEQEDQSHHGTVHGWHFP